LFFASLTLLVALLISSVAAYYSIVGLMAIFAAAKIPIAIMGVVLEIGKLVVASWTFRNWKTAPFLIRTYFISSIIVLMFITSLGIFGFLSRAHLEQSTPSKPLQGQIEQIQFKIEQKVLEKNRLETALSKLDVAFDKYIELGAVTKGLKARQETEDEAKYIRNELDLISNQLIELNLDKIKIENQLNLMEIEVGPIKYLANLIYDDVNTDKLEDAVRYIILLLILVFDPLAVVLVIAGNISFNQELQRRSEIKKEMDKITIVENEKSNRVIFGENILNIDDKETDPVPIDKAPDDQISLVSEQIKDKNIKTEKKDKPDSWIVSQWKQKGFKSPKAYISFLKKFDIS